MKSFIQHHSLASYVGIVFIISWGSGLVVLVPKMIRDETIPAMSALLLFPVLVIGVALTGITLAGFAEGKSGVRNLFSRIGRWRVGAHWYAIALLTPPVLILAVLLLLRVFVSPDFPPNFSPLGLLFGIFPGFLRRLGGRVMPFRKCNCSPVP